MKYKTMLVGLGSVGSNRHLPACVESDQVELTALCDINEERVNSLADKFDIAGRYTNLDEALQKERPAVTVLATPPDHHREATEKILAAGSHVIVEKPLAPTIADAEMMIKAMRKYGKIAMVNENYRWLDNMLAAREMIDAGYIGEPHWVQIEVYANPVRDYSLSGWLKDTNRLWFYEWGIHYVDVIRYWLKDTATKVYASFPEIPETLKGKVINPAADHINAAHISFKNNKSAFLLQYLVSQGAAGSRMRIEGDRGNIIISSKKDAENRHVRHLALQQNNGRMEERTFAYNNILDYAIMSHKRVLEHLVKCIESNTVPGTCLTDNIKALEIVLAAYKSADEGVAVEL